MKPVVSMYRNIKKKQKQHKLNVFILLTWCHPSFLKMQRPVFCFVFLLSRAWQISFHTTRTCQAHKTHMWPLIRRLHWIFWLKAWCEHQHFITNWTAASSLHLDDATVAVWRYVTYSCVLFGFMFEHMVAMGMWVRQ